MSTPKTSTSKKRSTAKVTKKSKGAASGGKAQTKKAAVKKTVPKKKITKITKAAREQALVEIEAALMNLKFDDLRDKARVKRLLMKIRDVPVELGFTKEHLELAKKFGADRIWWIDTGQKDERGEGILKKQIEFVECYRNVGAKITLAVEAMRRAAGGAPVLCPQTVSGWKKKYPDFGRALLFCEVRDFELTGQALQVATLGKKGFGPIVFKLVNQSKRLAKKVKGEGALEWLSDIEKWENIQRMEVGLGDSEDGFIEIHTYRRGDKKKEGQDGSEDK